MRTLEERLERITPTWKVGGTVDYAYQNNDNEDMARGIAAIFGDKTLSTTAGTTVAQLAQTLETNMGFSMTQDVQDAPSQQALHAMLSWNLPPNKHGEEAATGDLSSWNDNDNNNDDMVLFIFSFDATPVCYSVEDCPLPGPSNELLAATAYRFAQNQTSIPQDPPRKVHVIAQWEVASAMEQLSAQQQQFATETGGAAAQNNIQITPVGTPGAYQNSAEIFELMLCEWKKTLAATDSDAATATSSTQTPTAAHTHKALLLAHPDHLRRSLWTAQTILHQQQQHPEEPSSLSFLRKNKTATTITNCGPPIPTNTRLRIQPAMLPYDLAWPQRGDNNILNLYDQVPTRVHTQGQDVITHWYDDAYLGFFPDGDPQKWVHRRDVWILYDQWAIAKGIVTGTIDLEVCLGRKPKDDIP